MGEATHQSHRDTKRTFAGRIAEGVRARGLAGSPWPGATSNLGRLLQEYAVSRSSLRKAISRRASQGLIEIEKQRDDRVSPIAPATLSEVTELRMDPEPLALRTGISNRGLGWETSFMARLSWLNPTTRASKDQAAIAQTAIARDEDKGASSLAHHFERTSAALQSTLGDKLPAVSQ